jgi:hypothetical protein
LVERIVFSEAEHLPAQFFPILPQHHCGTPSLKPVADDFCLHGKLVAEVCNPVGNDAL